MQHVGVASWFNRLCNAQSDFVSRERIVWVDIEGVPLHAWSHDTFTKIGSKWGEEDNILEKFKIIVQGKFFVIRAKELFVWSPMFKEDKEVVYCTDDESVKGTGEDKGGASKNVISNTESNGEGVSDTYFGENEDNLGFTPEKENYKVGVQEVKDKNSESSHCRSEGLCSRVLEDGQHTDDHFSSVDCTNGHKSKKWGSILEVLDDMIKVIHIMGELNGKHKVNFLSLQETKMDSIFAMEVKYLWGNSNFEHIFREAIGNSGGILCTWDPNVFLKEQHILSDNFVAVFGTWIPTKTKLLIISIYAPQPCTEKRSLWNYIMSFVTRWHGDIIVMEDINEVRSADERMGSVFNVQGATEFNDFISHLSLVDIQLEGYSFTWSHPSASKMSKLDRFLVSKGLILLFPHISAICLDKHLSDHRPILLHDVIADYGATPFPLYHSWLSLSGFEHMVTHAWNSITLDDRNRMLDQGGVSDDILLSRMDLMKQLQEIKSSDAHDFLQKAKIQWSIEGDENSKFFHGIINRKRANLAIRGVMADGEWVDDPSCVKEEFRSHFATRFQAPSPITKDEIRNAVWACGENKSPRPDGFTFEFFRKFWGTIGPDLCLAVQWFFDHSSFSMGCNSSFIVLILKVHDPKFVSDYRPISLIGSLYKVVTKILAIRVVDAGIFKGIKIGNSITISHLFYVDDAVFVGLKINDKKSHLLGVGTSNDKIIAASSNLGCSVMKTPFKYLGVMVGGNMSNVIAWGDIICKVKSLLSKWKLKTLSIGGRLTLLKSVLGSTPIFWMSVYKVPKSVLSSMEAIQRNFFNGAQGNEKKITRVKWTKEIGVLKSRGVDLISHCKKRVGNGMLTRFWNDVWIGDQQLRGSRISTTYAPSGPYRVYDFGNAEDKWYWDLNGSGAFCVKDVRNLLDESFLPKDNIVTRWIKFIPIKINVFAWKVYLDRLPTRPNLLHRGIHVPSLSSLICSSALEDTSHLLFSCGMASDVVRLVCRWWDLVWTPLGSYSEWLLWFNSIRLGSKSKAILEGVFLCHLVVLMELQKSIAFCGPNASEGCDL
nr:RNA-directed DNA polymerase, eukaryota [Tanacetum cinerariifolium]